MEDTDVIHKKVFQFVEDPIMREFIIGIIEIERYYDTPKVKMDKYDRLYDRGRKRDE